MNVPSADNYSYYYNIGYYSSSQEPDTSKSGSLELPEFDAIVESYFNQYYSMPYIEYVHVSIWWSGYLNAGDNTIYDHVSVSYETHTPGNIVYIPVITWQADSFDEWILPYPTFSGILPGMTDSEFKQMFGLTSEGWEKVVRLMGELRLSCPCVVYSHIC